MHQPCDPRRTLAPLLLANSTHSLSYLIIPTSRPRRQTKTTDDDGYHDKDKALFCGSFVSFSGPLYWLHTHAPERMPLSCFLPPLVIYYSSILSLAFIVDAKYKHYKQSFSFRLARLLSQLFIALLRAWRGCCSTTECYRNPFAVFRSRGVHSSPFIHRLLSSLEEDRPLHLRDIAFSDENLWDAAREKT